MSAWKRARLYICRERKRSLRLALLFFVLALFMLLCGWVQASMSQNAEILRKTIGATFRIEDDADGKRIDDNLIETIAGVGNIRYASGENLQTLYSESVKPVSGMYSGTQEDARFMMSYYSGHYSALEQHFRTGAFELVAGRHITPEDTWSALISRDLAESNGLSIGDSFEAGFSPDTLTKDSHLSDELFSFQIVGIFEIVEDSSLGIQAEPSMQQNAVFIDATAGHAIDAGDADHTRYRYGAVFVIDDPRDLDETLSAVQSNLDMQHFTCIVDDATYRESVQPLERVETMMGILIVGLIVVGTIILALVLLLWIRQRIHEIGIYLSIGLSKQNILLQFLTESMASAIFACIVAVPASFASTAGFKIFNAESQMLMFPQTGSILGTILILLAVAILATLFASLRLFKLQPKEILLQ